VKLGLILAAAMTAGYVLSGNAALGHTQWANGDPVPAWIKSACCGPRDSHRLDPSQVSEDSTGYVVQTEGMTLHVRRDHTLPSQDGEYWIFYSPDVRPDPSVFCFFIPMAS
jgi:hypothetical protein